MSAALPSPTELPICNGAITLYAISEGEHSKKCDKREGFPFQTKPLGEIDLSKIGQLYGAPRSVQKAQGIAVLILRAFEKIPEGNVRLSYNSTCKFDGCSSESCVSHLSSAPTESPCDYFTIEKDGTSHHLFIPDDHPEQATLLEITVKSESDSAAAAKK